MGKNRKASWKRGAKSSEWTVFGQMGRGREGRTSYGRKMHNRRFGGRKQADFW
jgi:hypothetical protein